MIGENTNQTQKPHKSKKVETLFRPFLSLKPIKPIVDIQCMNNLRERYVMFLKSTNNRLRKLYFVGLKKFIWGEIML